MHSTNGIYTNGLLEVKNFFARFINFLFIVLRKRVSSLFSPPLFFFFCPFSFFFSFLVSYYLLPLRTSRTMFSCPLLSKIKSFLKSLCNKEEIAFLRYNRRARTMMRKYINIYIYYIFVFLFKEKQQPVRTVYLLRVLSFLNKLGSKYFLVFYIDLKTLLRVKLHNFIIVIIIITIIIISIR